MTEVKGPRPRGSGRWSDRGRQLLVLLGFAVVGVLAGRLVVVVLDRPAASSPGPSSAPAVASPVASAAPAVLTRQARVTREAAKVLQAWDVEHAAAYARGDPVALRRLYVPGSRAGAGDLRVLGAYAERGLVVRGLGTQLLSLRVRSSTEKRMVVEITERRVGGRAVGPGSQGISVPLPRDAPSTRVLALRRTGERWQVASVIDR